MTNEWQSTACILCECNCGIVVQLEGRTLAKIRGDKEHPASQGYTCNKALRLDHYQNNSSRLTSPMRRRSDGSYEEIDWDTAIAEIADGFKHIRDTHGGDKVFYYGGGGQGNHLGGALCRCVSQGDRGTLPLECVGAGEDRGGMGRRAPVWRAYARRVRARGGFRLHRQEPVDVAEFPACPHGAQRNRQGSGTHDDRHRPGDHRYGQDGRHPPAGATRCGRVVSGGDGRGAGAGKPLQRRVPGRPCQRCRCRSRRASAGAGGRLRGALRSRRGVDPYRGSPNRRRGQCGGIRGSRHSAGAQQHTVLLPEQAAVDSHRQLRQTRWAASAFGVRATVHVRWRRADPGYGCARDLRSGPVQRCAAGDPDRPSRPVPGDDRRKQQPGALGG